MTRSAIPHLRASLALTTSLVSWHARAAAVKRTGFDDSYNDAQQSFKMSQGIIIGIAIGCVVILILKVALIVWCVARNRRRRRAVAAVSGAGMAGPKPAGAYYRSGGGQTYAPSPYGAPMPARGPQVRPPGPGTVYGDGSGEQSVYAQQQALFDAYARPARNDEDVQRPLLQPEPEPEPVHIPALEPSPPRVDEPLGAVDGLDAPPAYEPSLAGSAVTSPGLSSSRAPTTANRTDPSMGSMNVDARGRGRDMRRDEKRGMVLEYQANGRT